MKCNTKNRPLTGKALERFQKENIKAGDRYLNFIQRAMLVEAHKAAGFGKERLHRLNEAAYWTGKDYIQRYSPEDVTIEDEEYAVDSYFALRRDLRAYGFDPDVEIWDDGFFLAMVTAQPSRALRDKIQAYANYAERMGFYVREMMCMVAIELHDTYGWGVDRMRRVMHPARDRYIALMRHYIDMDPQAVQSDMREMLDEYNSMGSFRKEYAL